MDSEGTRLHVLVAYLREFCVGIDVRSDTPNLSKQRGIKVANALNLHQVSINIITCYSTMKGNQGLEALAALCGGQSDVPTEGRVQNRDAAAAPANKNGSNSVGAQHQQVPQDASLQSSQRQTPMPNQQSPLAGLSAPQWQQAIAAISALQNSGVSPSLAQNLRHSGISSQGLGESNFSAMQQYALQQYMQAQAKLSQAQQAALAQSLGAYGNNNQQQALMIALAAGKAQQQLQHARGKFIATTTFFVSFVIQKLRKIRCYPVVTSCSRTASW